MNRIIPTCETAVCTIPEWHRAVFTEHQDRLTSADGWSPGALNLAQGVATKVHAQLLHNPVTRLLIDLARDPDDPARWSDIALTLTDEQRRKLDDREKKNYIETLETRILGALRQQETPIHISFDTRADLGDASIVITCDPRRESETAWARQLADSLGSRLPEARIRIDASPTGDLAAWLRKRQPDLISLRLTAALSSFLEGQPIAWASLKKAVIESIAGLR